MPMTATSEPHAKRLARPMVEQRPAHQAAGDQQQREYRRDHPRCDVSFGEVDGVEVQAELGEAEERRRQASPCGQARGCRPSTRRGCHGDGGDGEAVGHRPLRRHGAELAPDHDPGRAPDRGEDDEGNRDARAERRAARREVRHVEMPRAFTTSSTDGPARPINPRIRPDKTGLCGSHSAAIAAASRSTSSPC